MDEAEFIERDICTGFVISTEFLRKIRPLWKKDRVISDIARTIMSWCVTYFDKYGKAPGKDIQAIYFDHLRQGTIDKDKGALIEDSLESLSNQYAQEDFEHEALIDRTEKYLKERAISILLDDAKHELENGNTEQASELIYRFSEPSVTPAQTIDPFSIEVRSKVKAAFAERETPLISFPKALGRFWNQEMVRGGFVALMGREKIGKTFLLIETAMRGVKTGKNVAFFQAGDMTENQQLRRLAIYLARRSDQERYCGKLYIPVVDCLLNQTDACDKDVREDSAYIFENRKEITYESLVNALKQHPDHRPCKNCKNIIGSPWFKEIKSTQPLTWQQAYKALKLFGAKYTNRMKLSTHPNETLSVSRIKAILDEWERIEGWVADAVVIDYADILISDPDCSRLDFRQQQNKIWQRLRSLSESRHCLVLTATQIKAAGYNKPLLSMADFSEDKRKFAHVTALYGLNQMDEEKQIGLLRINELVVREGDFNPLRPVTILQRLQMGRPLIGSFR